MQTQGSLGEENLASLLSTIQSERATGTLELESGDKKSSLFFLFGHLFHATDANGQGEEVVVDALTWSDGTYAFDPRAKLPADETIKASPADLIAQAAQRMPTAVGAATTSEDVAPAWHATDSADDTQSTAETDTSETTSTPALVDADSTADSTWKLEPAPEAWATPPTPAPTAWSDTPVTPAPLLTPTTSSWDTPVIAPLPEVSAPVVAGAADSVQNEMYPLPGGKALYQGLKSGFVDFPKLVRTLRSDTLTGYIRLTHDGYTGTLLFDKGNLLDTLSKQDTVVQGEAGFFQFRRHMEDPTGLLDVVELSSETVNALAQLLTGQPMYTGLLGRFVNFDALLEYLDEEKISGSVVVADASEMGVILLRDGSVLGAYTESSVDLSNKTSAVSALAQEKPARIEVKSGGGSTSPIDIETALTKPY